MPNIVFSCCELFTDIKEYRQILTSARLIHFDWVVVPCLTQHKIGHFGDVSASQSLGLVWEKQYVTQQQQHTFTKQKKCTTTQNKHKKLKPGLVTFTTTSLEIQQVYSQGERWVRKKWRKKVKWRSIRYEQANNIQKSKVESRACYVPECARSELN